MTTPTRKPYNENVSIWKRRPYLPSIALGLSISAGVALIRDRLMEADNEHQQAVCDAISDSNPKALVAVQNRANEPFSKQYPYGLDNIVKACDVDRAIALHILIEASRAGMEMSDPHKAELFDAIFSGEYDYKVVAE